MQINNGSQRIKIAAEISEDTIIKITVALPLRHWREWYREQKEKSIGHRGLQLQYAIQDAIQKVEAEYIMPFTEKEE